MYLASFSAFNSGGNSIQADLGTYSSEQLPGLVPLVLKFLNSKASSDSIEFDPITIF